METGWPEPIIILTVPRSYSTVTAAILAGHPAIYGFPELRLNTGRALGDVIGDIIGEAELHWRLTGLCETLADLHEGDRSADALERARQWLAGRLSWPAKRVMDYLLAAVAPLIGLEKSPATVLTDEAIELCLSSHPGARYIHLARHPVPTQRSMQVIWTEIYEMEDPLLAERAAQTWLAGHQRIRSALDRLPAGQSMLVRAEDLLRWPASTLRPVLRWLELPCDEPIIATMLRTECSKFADTDDPDRLGRGDPLFFQSPAMRPIPDPGPVCFDPGWKLPEQTVRMMSELAHELGY